MPQIIVTADRSTDQGNGAVMLRERVNVSDFESDHFATQLVERLGWAVSDADDVEQATPTTDQSTVTAEQSTITTEQSAVTGE